MRFWDGSAIVPLLVREGVTDVLQKQYLDADGVLVWWGAQVECTSAIVRLERSGQLGPDAAFESFARLSALARSWHEIEPVEAEREAAQRFLRVHDLRAADALQLGAAFIASEGRPSRTGVPRGGAPRQAYRGGTRTRK